MSARTMMVLLLALVFGVSAVFLVGASMKQAPAPEKDDTVPVVVAISDIQRTAMVTADLVRISKKPKAHIPQGAISKIEDAVNRVATIPMVRDDILVEAKLAPKGSGRGLGAMIKKGMRAFTILTPNTSAAVAGFVLPGNSVDVLLTMAGKELDESDGGASTITLLQNVEILAVEQVVESPGSNKIDMNMLRSATLHVTPEQAARLELGQSRGTLHLSLRGLDDNSAASTRPATLWDLKGERPKPAPAPPVVVQAPVPAPVPEPLPVEENLELRIRTFRGTSYGVDRMVVPAPPRRQPAQAPAATPKAGYPAIQAPRVSENGAGSSRR